MDALSGSLDAVSTQPVWEQVGNINIPRPLSVHNQVLEKCPGIFTASSIFEDINIKSVTPMNTDIGPPMDFSHFLNAQPHENHEAPPDISTFSSAGPPSDEKNFSSEQDQEQHQSNKPLYEGSPLTVHDFMVSALSYAQSAHLTGASTAELINLIEMLLPKPNNLPKTSHMFKKYFEDNNNEIEVFFFCSNCWRSRQTQHDICDQCKGPNRKVNYFLSCSLSSQLKRLFNRPGFAEKLKYKYQRKKYVEENIEDVYDGSVYKKAEQDILINSRNLSLTWYSDGISIYECSTYSVWLVMFIINELPPEERHKPENVLIGGLWGGDGKPHPNIFLAPMYHEIEKLNEGVAVKPYGSEVEDVISVYLLCGTCDVPAKADFMNMKSHSGFFSCSKCFIRGEKSDRTGQVTVFPHQDELELRNDENYKMCVNLGINNKDGYKGVFGPSMLAYMFSSSFISGMTVDVMHSVYMGITKQFLRLWFDVKFKDEPFSLHEKIVIVNERLRSLNLPHFVQRLMLDIDKSLCFWKASLCRNFLLYVVLVVFKDIMPENYYLNLSKFVEGISLLNSSSISMSDLDKADSLLFEFCKEFQTLYGLRHMSFNLHLIRHLKDCVLECGNLFLNSCFRFEDLNGKFAALAHGTRHAIKQIGSRVKLVTELPLLIKSVKSSVAKNYCLKLSRRSKDFKINFKIENINAFVVGELTDLSKYGSKVTKLVAPLYEKPYLLRFFDRLFKNDLLFVSSSYGKGSRISCYCKYNFQGQLYHGLILTFFKITTESKDQYFALLERSLDLPAYNRYVEYSPSDKTDVICVSDLICVSFCLVVENHKYLIDPLNSLEFE
ncbi:Maintenance of telomere capping protein 2 [Frankliniella fusca]|uniref:Maintenance of telomere capping protein 2 n=1 Tax=Frankliniella fusca TaxID=407009 RepID=A0AAE1LTP5_9NEOP|nr:Maintenance of telomere capping protein 2 [Frankliniella fusca]